MEYLEGITLKQYLREIQRIAPEDLIELLVPLIESLDEIHSQGMIHRDISPDNIMVLPDGRIKLMDFGAARDYTEFGEKSLSIVLKPGYAPPEQYQTHGIQGPWTDIYALCATMYKCITGELIHWHDRCISQQSAKLYCLAYSLTNYRNQSDSCCLLIDHTDCRFICNNSCNSRCFCVTRYSNCLLYTSPSPRD